MLMKILIVCAGGMSSAIVVEAIKKEAEKQEMTMEIHAVGSLDFANALPSYDLALVAPQVKHRLTYFQNIGQELGKPVELIPAETYTPLGAPQILKIIKQYDTPLGR
jgi:PTS system cellobiose-specific IIB component